MYLHLGQSTVVRDREIVGVFDLEITSQSHRTRAFLRRAEKAGQVETVSEELPKAFLVSAPERTGPRRGGTRGGQQVYLSQLATATLLRRAEAGRPE